MKGKAYCPPGASPSKKRNIGGVKAPAYGSNPKIEAAAKGKSIGIIPGDGAKPRLDRPMRNRGGKC